MGAGAARCACDTLAGRDVREVDTRAGRCGVELHEQARHVDARRDGLAEADDLCVAHLEVLLRALGGLAGRAGRVETLLLLGQRRGGGGRLLALGAEEQEPVRGEHHERNQHDQDLLVP